MALFSKEELEELKRIDEEIDDSFILLPDEFAASRRLDTESRMESLDNQNRKIAEYQRAYREANKDQIAEKHREKRKM